ncbi:HET-domain-containing protein, partial [Westerdykella ornata]
MLHSQNHDKLYQRLAHRKRIKSTSKTWTCTNPLLLRSLRHQQPLYEPLAHISYIRLLALHPGKPGKPLKCTLHPTNLSPSTPPYEALSYVWHLHPGLAPITCNGHTKLVPANLHSALERLRHPDKARLLWVDNLCIAQDDAVEKTHQVRRMNVVYRRAARVLVWLGEDD